MYFSLATLMQSVQINNGSMTIVHVSKPSIVNKCLLHDIRQFCCMLFLDLFNYTVPIVECELALYTRIVSWKGSGCGLL